MTSCSDSTENSKLDAVLENIHNRKSVRQFTSEPVSDEHIEIMLKAAKWKPENIHYGKW